MREAARGSVASGRGRGARGRAAPSLAGGVRVGARERATLAQLVG
jgi:hypothetical protein